MLLLGACGPSVSPESLFATPSDITPSELERQGYEVTIDDGPHCILDGVDYFVSVGFDPDNKIEHIGINIDDQLFEKHFHMKPGNYDSVIIENQPYQVKYYQESNTIFASRLGL